MLKLCFVGGWVLWIEGDELGRGGMFLDGDGIGGGEKG